MSLQTRTYRYDFRGHHLIPTTAGNLGSPFSKADTSSAGAPTMLGLTGGGVRLLLASDNEIENLCLYMGDILPFDIDELISVEFVCKTVAAIDATTMLAFGVASARNDAIDTIGEQALFRMIGADSTTAVVVETDDGTNNNDDVATGMTLGTTWKRFKIDFTERVTTQEPPTLSTGSKTNIGFYIANDNGSLRRVASGTQFNMTNYSGGLQLFAQIQKTADTNTDNLDILEATVEVKLPDYA